MKQNVKRVDQNQDYTPILSTKKSVALQKDTRTAALNKNAKVVSLFNEKKIGFNPELLEMLLKNLTHKLVAVNPNRRITIQASFYVEDYETFGDNETIRRQQVNSAIISSNGLAQAIMNYELRMGGEIRVEFDVVASLYDSNGNAMLNCDLKLFEGTSESTNDLDGQRTFQLYCPAGATVNHFVRVNNDAEGDDDYATVQLTITNMPV
jgi:hypothetical protein